MTHCKKFIDLQFKNLGILGAVSKLPLGLRLYDGTCQLHHGNGKRTR